MQENNTPCNYRCFELQNKSPISSASNGVIVLPAVVDESKVNFAPRTMTVDCGRPSGDFRGRLRLDFQTLQRFEEMHGIRHEIDYQVRLNDINVGIVSIDSNDLNQSKHYSAENHAEILVGNPDIFDLLSKTLAALAHFNLIVGRFKFSQEMRQLEEWQYRETAFNVAQLLYAAGGEQTSDSTVLLSSNENNPGPRFRSNFGPVVRIQSIRRLPDTYKNQAEPALSVIWCTPTVLKRLTGRLKDSSFMIVGRHTYQQNLSSFLGLYPTPENHAGGIDFGQLQNHIIPGCKAVCDFYANRGMENANICYDFGYSGAES